MKVCFCRENFLLDSNDENCLITVKSALYLRLKKRKVFKTVKGEPFGLFENPICFKISKKIEGTLWRQKISKKNNFRRNFEIFEKKTKSEIFEKSHSAEILKRRDPLGFLVP